MNREEKIKAFVEAYEIEVPAAKVENELNYIKAQLRHGMQYDTLTGGALHIFPEAELEAQRAELERRLEELLAQRAEYEQQMDDALRQREELVAQL